jgi:hypothetical protein
MSCDYCDRSWYYSVYESDTEEICDRCWPKHEKRITARDNRWKEAGHDPTSDLCGCELCAARADRGIFGRLTS